MLTYKDLTAGQRKWVNLVEHYHPEVKGEVTYKQILEFHEEFKLLRKQGSHYKVCLALWLIGKNALRRGVYFFPGSGNSVSPKPTGNKASLAVQYKQELQNYGIV